MSKRATGEWVYGVTWMARYQSFEPYKQYLPLGYSQSHWRKINKEAPIVASKPQVAYKPHP